MPPGMVECYSGVDYAEEPRRFFWEGEWRMVSRIITRKRFPEGKQFEVEDEQGESFILTYKPERDQWTVRPAP